MSLTVIFQVVVLGLVEPFALKSKIHFEMFSECIVMMVMYHIICFTPFVPDLEVRFRLGYLVCALISSHLVVSLGILLKANLRDIRMKRWMYKADKGQAKFRSDMN